MSNKIAHVFSTKLGRHGLPFVSCEKHLKQSAVECAPYGGEVLVVADTDAACEKCSHDSKIRCPLQVLLDVSQSGAMSDEQLTILVHALGYKSIKEAWVQLRLLTASDEAEDMLPY